MEALVIALWVFATLWAAVLVHELGHYLMALTVGVPRTVLAIRLERPPHIALHDGAEWRSPDDPGYVDVFRNYAPSAGAAWLFVAGGFITETLAALLAAYLLRETGSLSLIVLAASTALLLMYIIGDGITSARNKIPYGDAGALWAIQPAVTLIFLAAVIALRTAAIILF